MATAAIPYKEISLPFALKKEPIFYGGHFYGMTASNILKLNKDAQILWALPSKEFGQAMVDIQFGTLFLIKQNTSLVALDAQYGIKKWEYEGDAFQKAVIRYPVILILTHGKVARAIDFGTGSFLWEKSGIDDLYTSTSGASVFLKTKDLLTEYDARTKTKMKDYHFKPLIRRLESLDGQLCLWDRKDLRHCFSDTSQMFEPVPAYKEGVIIQQNKYALTYSKPNFLWTVRKEGQEAPLWQIQNKSVSSIFELAPKQRQFLMGNKRVASLYDFTQEPDRVPELQFLNIRCKLLQVYRKENTIFGFCSDKLYRWNLKEEIKQNDKDTKQQV